GPHPGDARIVGRVGADGQGGDQDGEHGESFEHGQCLSPRSQTLFGNGRFSKRRFAPSNGRETAFRKTCIPKRSLGTRGYVTTSSYSIPPQPTPGSPAGRPGTPASGWAGARSRPARAASDRCRT